MYSQLLVRPAWPTKSFAGETAIVTGANVGLGKEAARHIARLGVSKLILAVRNTKAGDDAKNDIVSTAKVDPSAIEVWPLDLSSYASVKAFAERASKLPRLDVLLENAGIAGPGGTAEGHERMLTVNVISTFLLALLLLPKMKSTAKQHDTEPRLTIVSSSVHGWTDLPERDAPNTFAALDDTTKSDMSKRYPVSKLLEILALRQITPKLEGTGVILNTLNPGLCHSELARDAGWVMYFVKLVLARTAEVGSRTLVAAAAAGKESHGAYMDDGEVHNDRLSPFVTSAEGKRAAEKVWRELSEILEKIQPGVTRNV